MTIVDTHCHLYDEALLPQIDTIVQRAKEQQVQRLYMPCIDSSCIQNMLAVETQFPNQCFAMMGLHPCYVKENVADELAIVQQYLQQRPFVAIGEIGLDYYWDKTFAVQQQHAFTQQMQWALQYNLPIVIHTRNAMQETINMVKPFANKGLKGIFHCFSGSAESAQQIVNMGFLLGIGGVITYKNAGLPQALANIGIEHIVLETDAPYLSPVPFRGKPNESSYLQYIIAKLAEVKQLSIAEVAAITTNNANTLFGFRN
jgi:TatD DNase family protein